MAGAGQISKSEFWQMHGDYNNGKEHAGQSLILKK
jgi:hypothetical protein